MKRTFLALSLSLPVAQADFSDNQYTRQPDILFRIVTAAEKSDSNFHSSSDETTSYYLRAAEYIGPCEAPFGVVHIAKLSYTRSAPKDSKAPARDHTFIVFLDQQFVIRRYWTVGRNLELSASGSKISHAEKELFDFAHPPASEGVIIDGTLQTVPCWR